MIPNCLVSLYTLSLICQPRAHCVLTRHSVQFAQKRELAYYNYDYERNESQNPDPFSLMVVSLKTKLSEIS
jgi:hypothetical protein